MQKYIIIIIVIIATVIVIILIIIISEGSHPFAPPTYLLGSVRPKLM